MEDIALGPSVTRPQPQDEEMAIIIRDAVKVYDKNNVVFRSLNMTVPKGKIYGLLGPSGCGKTTLLSCIVGRSELDSGEIMVKALKREDIGYMPQDLNLHEHLTISQTFKFYGGMLNMDKEEVAKRNKELSLLLELPSDNRLIETLSGGQQRRVSLGVALLHNPNILILDEPTVGLDPVLSHSIWNHLVSFAEEGKTIIITTHYIEEARQAHTIGMMRGGILLAEDSPEILMTRCNTSTLEEAFLSLSYKQETSSSSQVDDSYKKLSSKKSNTKLKLNDGFFRLNRMNCLLYKNVSLLWHQKSFLVFLFLLPLVQTYFFNLAIGHDPKGLYIAVVNEEIQQRQPGECKPEYYKGCFLDNPQDVIMSCAYVEQMKTKSMNILHYNDVDTALKAVKKNDAWGLLYFPTNYTTSMAVRFINASRTSDLNVELSTVQAWIDLSDQYIGNMVKANVIFGMQEYLGIALNKCNISSKIGNTPISFREPVYGSVNTTFIHYASAAILCLCCYYLPVLLTAGLILTEKKEGIMERMMVSGIKFSEVLLSTVIMQMIIHAMQVVISMYVMYIYFDNPYLGDHFPTVLILLLLGMEGMIFGFLIGALCKDFTFAAYLGAGSNIMMSFTCGLIWPLEGAHYLLKSTGPLLPMTAPVKALLAVTAKGWSFDSEPVYMGLLSIFGWSTIMIITIFIISKLNKDLWILRK
ncbi:ABC transporter G family member 23-like [Melanaphis sacchari]|uniref:ABC transporter G family member 23 n=1 Tax=Melanaphis sacchari TaxID=742174 RepID=A0A2H8TII1_9HEMI|nr:ABC transporter G family member 23-like [Melanaphis sacchari]XP_025200630.1 ABC transporter G family member 23-like [Melanaphis sacchari]XP_025200632.1 ABC transporter G family member 23-like [Melanaphis sacchari]XP_025200633.1 ABC transporter G family member 23-like [Melanaphis sacchari]